MNKAKPFRADALEKVTGKAQFCADYFAQDLLHAVVCWPPVPVAKIIKIDISEAERMPGVERIITRKDITKGDNRAAVFDPYDRPILVGEGEMVRFASDPLALVVAQNRDQAERARDAIKVEYQELPGLHSLDDTKRADLAPSFEKEITKGNVEMGFAQAALILEEEYHIPYIEHAYLETESGYAYIDNHDTINVCFGSQNLGRHHRMICKSLGLPFHKVRLSNTYIGGAFGGKHSNSVQVYLALMADILHRAVKIEFSREESIALGCKKHLLEIKVKMGFDADGHILALKGLVESPAGPYFGYSRNTMDFAVRYLCGPYKVDNIDIKGKVYHTTGAEVGAYRGFGAADATMVVETMVNLAANKLGIDLMKMKKRNWLTNEQLPQQFPGAPWRNVSEKLILDETMAKVYAAAGSKPEPSGPHKKVGRGIASALPCFCIGNTPGYKGTGCDLLMFLDGTLLVRLGFPEAGQGITGVATRVAALAMDIPEENINVYLCDTHKTPKAGSLGFSQATVNAGNAILAAAKQLKIQLADYAREFMHSDDQDINYRQGAFWKGEEKVLEWSDIMDYLYLEGKNLSASGWTVAPDDTDRHGVTPISGLVDVEVDEITGEIKVLQVINCHDIGKVLHYPSARGQMIGGAMMNLGSMMSEEFIMKDGLALTRSFAEYLIPTAMDIPDKNIAVFIENYGEDCPLGGKGLGEHPLYTTAPAFLNAIYDAVGVLVTEIPVTSERLLKKLNRF